jgi:hypothetical protein
MRSDPFSFSADLFGGVARNFQVFEPLDFLAELTQHIPNKGEHLIRYYGCYSSKSRGQRAKQAAAQQASCASPPSCDRPGTQADDETPPIIKSATLDRRRWAMLIQRIYQADPLRCPQCGGTMKIIAFIEARQEEAIRKILQHCGLWHDPPPCAPPRPSSASRALGLVPQRDPGFSVEPERVVIRAIADGTHPASIFVDFDSVDGAVYEVQWFSDAPLTQMVGSSTVTESQIEITGLTRGSQYWVRVRAVRASQPGPWSDQATRVANI